MRQRRFRKLAVRPPFAVPPRLLPQMWNPGRFSIPRRPRWLRRRRRSRAGAAVDTSRDGNNNRDAM